MPDMKFECSVCCEDVVEPEDQVRRIDGDPLCTACTAEVVPLFQAAIDSEVNYPPRWGPALIDFDQFRDLFSADLRKQWPGKVVEYNTPIKGRVYCAHKVAKGEAAASDYCNTFIGDAEQASGIKKCTSCGGSMCLDCIKPQTEPAESHDCDARKPDAQADVIDQETKGKEWQQCPNASCKAILALGAGCNAMDCLYCGSVFCFICGESVEHFGDHWLPGKPCPRYNQPGAHNAIFDDLVEESIFSDTDGEEFDAGSDFGSDAGREAVVDVFGLPLTRTAPTLGESDSQNVFATQQRWASDLNDEFGHGSPES